MPPNELLCYCRRLVSEFAGKFNNTKNKNTMLNASK